MSQKCLNIQTFREIMKIETWAFVFFRKRHLLIRQIHSQVHQYIHDQLDPAIINRSFSEKRAEALISQLFAFCPVSPPKANKKRQRYSREDKLR